VPFKFIPFEIPGLVLIQPQVFGDNRGFFLELYKHADFVRAGITEHFVQDNFSRSSLGVLRGMHYQKSPKTQGKLVLCINGRIYDVAVDIRKGSPHYGTWAGIELSGENRSMLYVPPGFAHGFQVISETAEVQYKCTEEYSPADERGIIWNDKNINIVWPIVDPILSGKDEKNQPLQLVDNDFVYSDPT
jgi:dTDP-4-dehydrorhamnose 3,5-epimerase